MKEPIGVSIICNTYNHEKYIRDALEGFIKQKTTFPFEVLIHDDASTDSTASIIREYESKYPELIKPIYETENQYSKHDNSIKRIQANRTTGKYVALCEGDDYWTDLLKLEKQYTFMESHPEYTLCGCSTQWLNMLDGKVTDKSTREADADISLKELLSPKNGRPFPLCSFFIRTDIWKQMPRWGFPVGDLPLTYYSAMQGKVRMLADTMCVYRWNVQSSWTARNAASDARAETVEKMIRGFETMNRDTNYQYNEIIKNAILERKYTLALMRHDLKSIKSKELIRLYKNRPLLYRISDVTRCTFPNLYHYAQIILKKNR